MDKCELTYTVELKFLRAKADMNLPQVLSQTTTEVNMLLEEMFNSNTIKSFKGSKMLSIEAKNLDN